MTSTAAEARLLTDSAVETVDLPLVLAGRLLAPASGEEWRTLTFGSGVRVRLPRFTREHLAQVRAGRAEAGRRLRQLSTDEITCFLGAVSDEWLSQQAPGRLLADAYAHRVTGYPAAMLAEDYATIGHFMNERFHSYDQIAAEFGDERIFDEWVSRQMSWVRAFPRGLAVQYLVGNLPLAGLYSLLRGILTRNVTLAKLPSRDPVSAYALTRTMVDLDPAHPVTRSLTLCYWPHGDPVGDEAIGAADCACVWGGEQAVDYVRRRVRAGVPVAEFGPKWSAAAIDLTACDPQEAADRLAEDVGFYDQEACFSTQRAFVRGDVTAFVDLLAGSLERFGGRFPQSDDNRDALAHRSASALEATYLGLDVRVGRDWVVVVVGDEEPAVHPLTRTVYLHRVDDWDEVAERLDDRSQTLSVFPPDLAQRHRDDWAAAGADRITELGWARLPRAGWTHDGVYGMHPMVRLATAERPRADFGKYYPRPRDHRAWQREYFRGEQWFAVPWFLRGQSLPEMPR